MSTATEDEIKRGTAKRKNALMMEVLQGKTTVAEANRSYDLPPSEIETWIDEAKRGMENALRARKNGSVRVSCGNIATGRRTPP